MSLYVRFRNGRAEFFDSRLTAPPSGAAKISEKDHAALMAGQGMGKVIVADEQGKPALMDAGTETPPVPGTASRFQARMALRNAGLFEAAEAAVRDSGDALLQEAWDSATEFRRASPAIHTLGAALGLDTAALDQLFRDAAQITA